MRVGVYIAGRSPGQAASSTFGPPTGSKEGRDDVTQTAARCRDHRDVIGQPSGSVLG